MGAGAARVDCSARKIENLKGMIEAHCSSREAVLKKLEVDPEIGLSASAVRQRRRQYGRNQLRQAKRESVWRILVEQFNGVIVWLLAAAAGLSFYFRNVTEAVAILAVLAINSAIGFATEIKAVRSMEGLRRLTLVKVKVRRGGAVMEIPAEELVPGDVVLLEGGDIVAADLRLLEAANLQCDESTLTGESVPVAKTIEPLEPETVVADWTNMAFKGTAVTGGSGAGTVVATGMATELGRISEMAQAAEAALSPLEKRLDRLGGQLVWVTLALTVLIAAVGVYTGRPLLTMVQTTVALAVAAIPEGLPIVATVALARGMWRMARRNALIERLSAVETLGATTVVMTDKTGTLTENRMTVERLVLPDGVIGVTGRLALNGPVFEIEGAPVDPGKCEPLHAALRVALLCNNASLSDNGGQSGSEGVGDPMELALLAVGRQGGLERSALLRELPELREEAFTTETKMMATIHHASGGFLVAVKGAPEAVIGYCSRILSSESVESIDEAGRAEWLRRSRDLAADGFRVLALATKEAGSEQETPYQDLTLLGLVGLLDPPRSDVPDAIAACRKAGVRVVMLTGDHTETASKIARDVGLINGADARAIQADDLGNLDELSEENRQRVMDATIFARISPKTKLDLVSLYQSSGAVVAMTGDGVNDAPALKKADIGIAMGQRGTQVAREAADMVLRDDSFPSIVAAMEQGRVIFGNIRKFVIYLMSCNLSEILIIGVATLGGLPLPLLPLHILYLNLVTDVFPAFALGVGEGEPDIMRHPPRNPGEPIVDAQHWWLIGAYAAMITIATLASFTVSLFWLDMSEDTAISVAFLTLAFGQLWHVFNMRARGSKLLLNEVTRNPFIWAALALCAALILSAIYAPGLSSVLALSDPGFTGWVLAFGASLAPFVAGQVAKAAARDLVPA